MGGAGVGVGVGFGAALLVSISNSACNLFANSASDLHGSAAALTLVTGTKVEGVELYPIGGGVE